ncbi:30S ribosomal protein THX [Halpernia sp.]|uniref:30S ribosomal protein THX n=1 Tax=Halpernia sp. TaxID=2782209 RepID=UPI003A95A735
MGKGDKKTKRGKIIAGSYGKSRMKKESVPLYTASTEQKAKVEKAPKDEVKKEVKPKAKVATKKAVEKETKVEKKEPKTAKPKAEKTKKAED